MWYYWLEGYFHGWAIWRRDRGTHSQSWWNAIRNTKYYNQLTEKQQFICLGPSSHHCHGSLQTNPVQSSLSLIEYEDLCSIFSVETPWDEHALVYLLHLLNPACCMMLGMHQRICIIINSMLLIYCTPKMISLWYIYITWFWSSDTNGCDGCKTIWYRQATWKDMATNQRWFVENGESICNNIVCTNLLSDCTPIIWLLICSNQQS